MARIILGELPDRTKRSLISTMLPKALFDTAHSRLPMATPIRSAVPLVRETATRAYLEDLRRAWRKMITFSRAPPRHVSAPKKDCPRTEVFSAQSASNALHGAQGTRSADRFRSHGGRCKTLATQRMKRSGMRWGEQGGQAILSFRALVQSNRFERAWTLLAHTYKAEVTTLDNVVPIRSWQ